MRTENPWPHLEIRKVASVKSGGTPARTVREYWENGTIPWVTTSEVDGSVIEATEQHISDIGLQNSSAKLFTPGTILVAMYGQGKTRGQSAILGITAATNQACAAILAGPTMDSRFLFQYLTYSYAALRELSNSGGQHNLSAGIIAGFHVPVPPLPEQRKIAEILGTWDEAIWSLRAGVDLEQKRYSALANRLVDPGETPAGGNRKVVRLSAVTRELTKRNSGERLSRSDVMGVSNKVGLFPMREQTIADDISRYKLLPPKSLAYNPMRINVGSIAMSEEKADVLVSPDYVLFECLSDQLIPEYLLHLMNSDWWSYQMNSSGSGSVRSRIYYRDLAALNISLPSLGEQSKICEVLAASQRLTTASIRHIELLQEQKHGLMQQLLTGKIRVNVDEGEAASV